MGSPHQDSGGREESEVLTPRDPPCLEEALLFYPGPQLLSSGSLYGPNFLQLLLISSSPCSFRPKGDNICFHLLALVGFPLLFFSF